jgi:hypothetical protein
MRFTVHAPTDGVPPLGSVMTPSLTRTYAGWSSRGRIVGRPGTVKIPMGDPAAVRENVVALASGGTIMTWYAPNYILPSQYWEAEPGPLKEHAPVSRLSDNQMPIPARRAPNVIVHSPYVARKGGQRQVYQPQVVQSWRGMKGTSNG